MTVPNSPRDVLRAVYVPGGPAVDWAAYTDTAERIAAACVRSTPGPVNTRPSPKPDRPASTTSLAGWARNASI